MNARDTMALLGYAAMLDDTVDLRDESNGMSGGDPVRTLMNEVQRIEAEIIRLKIAHLRRMVHATCAAEERALKNFRICMTSESIRYSIRERQIVGRIDRFRSACLAKITELKESQCSTKS